MTQHINPTAKPQAAAVLLLAVLVLVMVLLLRITDEGQVRLPLLDVSVPSVCGWQRLVGFDCPFCGLTRCFISAVRGQLSIAWHYHPAGVVLFLAVLAQLPYRGMQLRRLAQGEKELEHPVTRILPWLLIAAFVLAWLPKVFTHLFF